MAEGETIMAEGGDETDFMLTEKGAITLSTSGNARVDLFYHLTRDATSNPAFFDWIRAAWEEDPLDTMRLLFHARDCRGGKGDRAPFLLGMAFVAKNWPGWLEANINSIPLFGRYLDLVELLPHVRDACSQEQHERFADLIADLQAAQLGEDLENMQHGRPVTLLAKWLPSENKKWHKKAGCVERLCKKLFKVQNVKSEHLASYRRTYTTPLRAYLNVVEKRMCRGEWDQIDFAKVPSVAMNRLRATFQKHAPEHFLRWIRQVRCGESKVNASQVYPHDLVRHYMDVAASRGQRKAHEAHVRYELGALEDEQRRRREKR